MGQGEAVREIYIKPWCRIGPYAVGFLAGYILYRTKCKIRIPKVNFQIHLKWPDCLLNMT